MITTSARQRGRTSRRQAGLLTVTASGVAHVDEGSREAEFRQAEKVTCPGEGGGRERKEWLMAIAVRDGWDATHQNINTTGFTPPTGYAAAGYSTGTASIAWTSADWARFPGAVRIDQSPDNTAMDELSDVLDKEAGAATDADVAPWAKAAEANRAHHVRVGQRIPAIYQSRSAVTGTVSDLSSAGLKSGVGLWIADYSMTRAEAVTELQSQPLPFYSTANPYPKIGIQYSDQGESGLYDLDVFVVSWLQSGWGPARHVANGKTSLVDVARRHSWTVEQIVRTTIAHASHAAVAALAEYLGGGSWAPGTPDNGALRWMPAGLVYWTPY